MSSRLQQVFIAILALVVTGVSVMYLFKSHISRDFDPTTAVTKPPTVSHITQTSARTDEGVRTLVKQPAHDQPTSRIPLAVDLKNDTTGLHSSALRFLRVHPKVSNAIHAVDHDADLSIGERAAMKAILLSHCAAIALRSPELDLPPHISPRSPNATVRVEAAAKWMDSHAKERCAGIDPKQFSELAVRKQWESAAGAGDPRGKAAAIDYHLRRNENVGFTHKLQDGQQIHVYKGPSETETAILFKGLESKDPAFIRSYGTIFFETFHDVDFVFGPKGEKLEIDEFSLLWEAVSCFYGSDCSPNHREVAAHCANLGKCDSTSYLDYLERYALTSDEWERFQRIYPSIVEAIRTGKWEGAIDRRSPPSGLEPFFWDQNPFKTRIRVPGN